MVKVILKRIVYWVTRLTPKLNYVYLKGMPSYEDSMVSIYEALPIDKISKVIWSVYDLGDKVPFKKRSKTIIVQKGSLKDFYYGIISKYIFTSHGHFISKIPSNQTCVNVWHGMPIKGIGLLGGEKKTRQDTYLCSTSLLFQDIMSRAFDMSPDRVLISGIPRNDLLQSLLPSHIWEKAGIDRSKYDKVFFWLPTYRKSVLGYITEDGVEVDNVFNIKNFPVEDFEEFLKEQRCLCIIKPHPMAPRKEMKSSEHILMIDEAWLWSRKLTLYPLVGVSDFLVSDISSIMIDYLLLDRPMIVCFEDVEEYQKSRAVIFNPIEEYLPGEIVHQYANLKNSILKCIAGEDPVKEKRQRLKREFHEHWDFQSTTRLMSVVFGSEFNVN